MNSLEYLVSDWRWAMNMKRARAWRRNLSLKEREKFDYAFCRCSPGGIYNTTIDDLCRAMLYSKTNADANP